MTCLTNLTSMWREFLSINSMERIQMRNYVLSGPITHTVKETVASDNNMLVYSGARCYTENQAPQISKYVLSNHGGITENFSSWLLCNYNKSQISAIHAASINIDHSKNARNLQEPFTLIQGPPGTGI
jgi:hypothetical protein